MSILNKGFSIKSPNYLVRNNKRTYHTNVKLFNPIVRGEEVKIQGKYNLQRLDTGIKNVDTNCKILR